MQSFVKITRHLSHCRNLLFLPLPYKRPLEFKNNFLKNKDNTTVQIHTVQVAMHTYLHCIDLRFLKIQQIMQCKRATHKSQVHANPNPLLCSRLACSRHFCVALLHPIIYCIFTSLKHNSGLFITLYNIKYIMNNWIKYKCI